LRTFEVAAMVLAAGLVPTLAAHAEDPPITSLGSYALGATGTAVYQSYDQQTVPIPAVPTQEFSVARSEVSLENGSAHGLSSLAWPGNTAANFPSALYDLGYPKELPAPPNYPVRAESFFPRSGTQKTDDTLDAGVVVMKAASSETFSTASARSADVEGLFTSGAVSSSSSSEVKGAAATSEARAAVTGFELLGGLVTIESVRSVATATSDGVKGEVTGRTLVTGLTIQGQEFTVDRNGVHVAGNDLPPPPGALDSINEQLAAIGISVFIAEPLDQLDGPSAARSIGGLIIVVKGKTLGDRLPPITVPPPPDLPPPLPQIPPPPAAVTDYNRTLTISLGAVAVTTSAGGFLPPPPPPPTTLPPPVDEVPLPPAPIVSPAPVDSPPAPGTSPAASNGTPAGKTLPISIAVAGLIGAAATSRGLRRVADKALADTPAGAVCTLEDS
jgi:hypothetical protein